MKIGRTTLEKFLSEHKWANPKHNLATQKVILGLSDGVKNIALKLAEGGVFGQFRDSPKKNSFGEQVKLLDQFADTKLIYFLMRTGKVFAVFSEEKPQGVIGEPDARHIVFLDPFDGSSLVDANAATGSIFSVYITNGQPFPGTNVTNWDFRKQICAGYCLYGPATLLVLAFESGVYEFVWQKHVVKNDEIVGDFVLSGARIKLPDIGAKEYSINEGYSNDWSTDIRGLITCMKTAHYSSRYAGALVADFHRILKHGGIFLYPGTPKHPEGKLRLFFEVAPLAYVIEKTGGFAVAGRSSDHILDIKPNDFKQRTPLILGHQQELQILEDLER